jgi:tripartite-type tricarboxylate transporter receptor subunit TctC
MGAVATHAINPWLYAKLPYDPIRDFTPITGVAQVPNVLVMSPEVAGKLGIAGVADLVAYARKNPASSTTARAATAAPATSRARCSRPRPACSWSTSPTPAAARRSWRCSPGQVDLNFDNLAAASANIKAGKLKALAVTTAKRSSAMPDVPTIAEAGRSLGLGSFDIDTWFGIFGPAQLPADVTARLNKAFVDALESNELKTRLASLFAESMAGPPDRFAAFVRKELGKYEKVVKASGARIE